MKTPTATYDRIDNRGNPHTPCPLVHPFPRQVPAPTSNPDKAKPKISNPEMSYSGGENMNVLPLLIGLNLKIIQSTQEVIPIPVNRDIFQLELASF